MKTEFENGSLVFFRTKLKWFDPLSWLSAAIRYFAKIKYNHTGIIFKMEGIPFIFEAVGRGVICTEANYRLSGKITLVRTPRVPPAIREFRRAVSKAGHTKYDFVGLLFYQLFFQIFHIWIGSNNKNKADDRFYCYEF